MPEGTWDIDLVAGPYAGRTDGPVWDGKGLLFSAIGESKILRYDPSSGEVSEFRRHVSRLTALAFDRNGTLYGCQSGVRRLVRFNADGSTSPLENKIEGRMENHPDDLTIDARGNIWFSDPYDPVRARGVQIHGPLDHASVLCLQRNSAREWQLTRVTHDSRCPRAVLLSADEKTLYVSENGDEPAWSRELRAYVVEGPGRVGAYTVLHVFGADCRGVHRGIEGMCLDSDGNLVACGGWSRSGPGPLIYVFAPSGRVLETHIFPVDEPTNVCFGGDDLATLYVTTAGGHLYRIEDCGRRGWTP